jgi:class 3 adenylate cyclase/tetratricopeptide (TPR) repeat protein
VPAPACDRSDSVPTPLRVNLLGQFSVSLGDEVAGPWPRPTAKRLFELVLISAGLRVLKEAAREKLFPNRGATEGTNGLNQALSMARSTLSALGQPGRDILKADRSVIWVNPAVPLAVDLDLHREMLRRAMGVEPGLKRDHELVLALANEGLLVDDEPSAEWLVRPREQLEWERQEARLTLARDRARGYGRAQSEAVMQAWDVCLAHDPGSEEAASALIRLYGAQKRYLLVEATYERCRGYLEEVGLRASPALEEAYLTTAVQTHADRQAGGHMPAAALSPIRDERRIVSVVFVEVKGPAGTSQRLSAEEVRDVVGGVLADVVAEVEGLGGTVTSVSGAGLVAVFGAPISHEDDPERALRAALRAVDTTRGASQGDAFVRAGIETGPAVLGHIGGASTAHYGPLGDVVGTAAALQSVARPGSVLVGPATRSVTEAIFEWGQTEAVTTRPGVEPLVASYLERPKDRPVGQPGRHLRTSGARLVGRRTELGLSREVLRSATGGDGAVMLVTGEPGLGKTRLVSEFRKMFMTWVGASSGRLPLWLEGRAASYAAATPYGLYRQLLSAWVGVAPEQHEMAQYQALEQAVKAIFGRQRGDVELELISLVMGLGPVGAGGSLARLPPERLQRATFDAFRSVISKLVQNGPTVLVLEDLHWADPTSLRLTEELASVTAEGSLLIVLTCRPEPDPGVATLESAVSANRALRFHRLVLAPLTQTAERQLARSLLDESASEEVVDVVCRGADGNPLFLEERLSSLLDSGAVARNQSGWTVDRRVPQELPEVVERLVRSRVDRLRPAPREALVAAAVLGPEFPISALAAVADLDTPIDDAAKELCADGLLVEVGDQPEPAYRFRHALIMEATYQGLLRDDRKRLHARAAWGLEHSAAGRLEEAAGLLGHHYAMAGQPERAAHYLEMAADRAAAAFANDEAVASYRWELELGEQFGAAPTAVASTRRKLSEVYARLGRYDDARALLQEAITEVPEENAVLAARCYCQLAALDSGTHRQEGALVALEAAERALERSGDKASDDWVDAWLDVQSELVWLYYWSQKPDLGGAVVARARPVMEAMGSARQKAQFYNLVALQRFSANNHVVDDSILADFRAERAAVVEGGLMNERYSTWFCLGFALLWYGDLDQAQAELEGSLGIARRVGDRTLEVRTLTYLLLTRLRQHDVPSAKELAPQLEELARGLGFDEYVAQAKAVSAWAAWKEGSLADAEHLAEEALDQWERSTFYPVHWPGLWPLVAVRLGDGRVAEAIDAARQLVQPRNMRIIPLEPLLLAAIKAWEENDKRLAATHLSEALIEAEHLRYA